MLCPQCEGKQAYKQLIDFIWWLFCPECKFNQRLKCAYFFKKTYDKNCCTKQG